MTNPALQPIRWAAMPRRDFEGLVASQNGGRLSLSGGFAQAASAQAAYYEAGTIHGTRRLRAAIDRLATPLPTTEQIAGILDEEPSLAGQHTFDHHDGWWWWLRSQVDESFGDPFAASEWQVLLETNRGWNVLDGVAAGEFVPALQLLPLLSGRATLKEVQAALSSEPARELFTLLVESNAIRPVHDDAFDVATLPNLVMLGHASLAIRAGQTLVLVDPVVIPENESFEPKHRTMGLLLAHADAILISHHHWDHLHLQTLARVPRTTAVYVPRSTTLGPANPPVGSYLRSLGFANVREVQPWQTVAVGELEVRFAPFRGEPFGLESTFDAVTYWLEADEFSIFGTVDAWRDESGDMTEAISNVAALWGRPDVMLFGSSGQRHVRPYAAAGLRHLSNELRGHPDLLQYHPTVSDVEPWVRELRPRALLPYAHFGFGGEEDAMSFDALVASSAEQLRPVGPRVAGRHREWLATIDAFAGRVDAPVAFLAAHHGIWFGDA